MTTLYIKTHNITGLKYFGKTTNDEYHKYKGSGVHWKRHIKKHGYDVTTQCYAQFDETDYIERILLEGCAILFSTENNIENSKAWANFKPENGLDGNPKGIKFSDAHKRNLSISKTGFKHTEESKNKMSVDRTGRLGTPHTAETKAHLSVIHSGKILSAEHKKNIGISRTGKKHSKETLRRMSAWQKGIQKERVRCPFCKVIGGGTNMKRYHFNNCKLKNITNSSTEGTNFEEHF